MITVTCRTLFDITPTEIKSNFNENRVPCETAQQIQINDAVQWNRARNQQRNWETINQIIALRCLPEKITRPEMVDEAWQFHFYLEDTSCLSKESDDLNYLKLDAHGVPMIVGLQETAQLQPRLDAIGSTLNIWFEVSDK